ncbi:hypothetical protein M8J76_015589 [Diaphorina citri]|nr:hypothetical protein M8J76_015589 [Diaphorina citri]
MKGVLLLTFLLSGGYCQQEKQQKEQQNQVTVSDNIWINKLFFNHLIDFVPESRNNSACNQQMHDSSIFTLGGVLTGNTNQFGHPNQCVETSVPEFGISGQYCLATAEIQRTFPVAEGRDGDLTQSVWETISTNRTELIKHPRSYFRWGLCIPNECTGRDLEKSLRQSLTRGFLQAGIKVTIRVPEENCYVKADLGSLPVEACCLLGFLGLLLVLVIWATIRDLLQSDSLSPNPARLSYSRAFSIIYNTQRLCKVDKNEEMTIIYGIKFLAMTTMVIGHKVILLVGNNVQNKDRIERKILSRKSDLKSLEKGWRKLEIAGLTKDTVNIAYFYFLNGSLLVDTFFVISGFLSAHQLVQHFNRSKNVDFVLVVLDRIVRIIPSYALVIGFYVWVLPYLNDGPLWKAIVLRESHRCQENWWTNILFVNNFFNENQMCMLQSWFLAVDFQLFLLSFLLIYLCWKWPSIQKWLLGATLLVCMVIPGFMVYRKREWSFFIPSISNLYDPTQVPHFREMYTKSYNRAIPYVIGIMGAFYTKHLQQAQFQFSSVAVKIFMFSAAVIGTHIMFIVPMLFVSSGHQYNVWEHVLYAPLHRLVWAVAMCNFIVVHNAGGYGVISSFLGCRLFAPLSRLCYGVYLTHVAIMLIELGSSHNSEYVTMIGLTQDIFGDLSMSLLASFVLNLLLESPLDTFHKKLKRSILNHMEASKRTQVYPISAQVGIDSRRTYLKPTGILPRYKIDPEDNQS